MHCNGALDALFMCTHAPGSYDPAMAASSAFQTAFGTEDRLFLLIASSILLLLLAQAFHDEGLHRFVHLCGAGHQLRS